MDNFFHHFSLAYPLFLLVLAGYAAVRLLGLPKRLCDGLARFAFAVALPAMLFRLMSNFSKLPPVDWRLLLAFFGACLIVFVIGRVIAWKVFGLDGVGQSVFALGGVFSNNVMLGLPMAKIVLGDAALPSAALVIVFNALVLWTLVTVSVELARHGSFSLRGGAKALIAVLGNPIIAAILAGTLYGLAGFGIAEPIDAALALLGQAAAPLALIALGMGLAAYGIRDGLRLSLCITAIKLLLQPLVVWLLAVALALPPLETQVVVLLASIAVGSNVYLMSRQFGALEGAVAGSLLLSTLLSALTTPLALAALNWGQRP